MTSTTLFFIGWVKETSGPNKDKIVPGIKRSIQFNEIKSISLSTLADDFVVLHNADYDTVFECIYKTEFITLLLEKYPSLKLNFNDSFDKSNLG